jgi:SAM-dependent methyltransferase
MSTAAQERLLQSLNGKIEELTRDLASLQAELRTSAPAGGAKHYTMLPYEELIAWLMKQYPPDVAMYRAIGCETFEAFCDTGNTQVAVLKHYGLRDGMAIYDLGCGSGRTAQALIRAGWKGTYKGADIVPALVDYVNAKCPGFEAVVNRDLSILADDASQDRVYHWSVFTHLFVEECYLYMQDIFRALKPGGRMLFSFLELESDAHRRIFNARVAQFRSGSPTGHLDTFLHRDWIRRWAAEIGFSPPVFTDGADGTRHRATWQTLVVMDKPAG